MTKLEALDKAIGIWETLEKTGKYKAERLFTRYLHGCPLCELYNNDEEGEGSSNECVDCPWPDYEDSETEARCEESVESPYRDWIRCFTRQNYDSSIVIKEGADPKKHAHRVVVLLKRLRKQAAKEKTR